MLCDACSVLRFDDAKFGGFEGDCGVLEFPDDEQQQYFDLEYDRRDLLPHLPNLELSANAGCQFCKVLRGSNPYAWLEQQQGN
ncbi:hypothetical protein K458DRAFT_413575 [Lentithecium fluviatile CBS 122367]|uniref:Uncharacterized protein n=1 Tax=Lentithecium fluviatile CBS 122367 TaxID=1168545 RepID=A0A6G1JFR5_9PLEO|nr:hypothetical protein K458DRAFT_413575 [Lentithecium fluviatile CBS 122367]